MPSDLFLAFVAYAFVTSITPGPNNTLLLASGATYGFRRTVPMILGVTLGFSFMVLAVGLGLGGVFLASPMLHDIIRVTGAGYLAYLAWKMASAPVEGIDRSDARPLGFARMAAFQWVNPKAWIMAVGAVATYAPQERFIANIALLALVYLMVNAPCVTLWAGFGTMLRGILASPLRQRLFNIVMALMLLGSLYPILTAVV